MKEKYLPLGTIVLLKNATRKVMIIGYCGIDLEKKVLFDYVGAMYPEGFLGSTINLVFNHNEIDKIIAEAEPIEEGKKYLELLNEKFKTKTNEELYNEFINNVNSLKAKNDQKKRIDVMTPASNIKVDSFGDF